VHVDIAKGDDGGGYTISVRDRGAGIPLDIQSRIFDRFYRGDSARVRPQPDDGAGLGLALARWIANVHGGDVTLRHSSPEGTVFTVVLPQHT
jgi:signal transduction histidine kinase